jgi:hypothetical protein
MSSRMFRCNPINQSIYIYIIDKYNKDEDDEEEEEDIDKEREKVEKSNGCEFGKCGMRSHTRTQ